MIDTKTFKPKPKPVQPASSDLYSHITLGTIPFFSPLTGSLEPGSSAPNEKKDIWGVLHQPAQKESERGKTKVKGQKKEVRAHKELGVPRHQREEKKSKRGKEKVKSLKKVTRVK